MKNNYQTAVRRMNQDDIWRIQFVRGMLYGLALLTQEDGTSRIAKFAAEILSGISVIKEGREENTIE